MYVRNSSKKRKYLIVKLFGTRSCDGSLYVCCCRYKGCINRRDVHITEFQKYNNMVELVHIASKAERQVQEDMVYNKPKTYFTYKQAPTTNPPTPSGSSSNTTKLPFKPTLPQGKPPPSGKNTRDEQPFNGECY